MGNENYSSKKQEPRLTDKELPLFNPEEESRGKEIRSRETIPLLNRLERMRRPTQDPNNPLTWYFKGNIPNNYYA